jgi:hypothetical protein
MQDAERIATLKLRFADEYYVFAEIAKRCGAALLKHQVEHLASDAAYHLQELQHDSKVAWRPAVIETILLDGFQWAADHLSARRRSLLKILDVYEARADGLDE